MTAPDVSIVIPLYNDADTIGAVLAGLEAQNCADTLEIIVVDDGSQDTGPRLARDAGAHVVTQKNAGPSAARNTGAKTARAPLVLFLDADCTPPPTWVADMTEPLKAGQYDAVMGTIAPSNDGPVPRIVQAEVEGRYSGMRQATDGVDFIAAPACGMRRDVFEKLEGFDQDLRQAEDVEMAYRLRANGHRIAFVDQSPVRHAHQTGLWEFLTVKYRRAVGRMEVFARYPDKLKADNWTPFALKAQFGMAALAGLGLLIWLVQPQLGWRIAGAALLGLWAFGARDISATASALNGSTSYLGAWIYAIAFVSGRAFAILMAVLKVKTRKFWPSSAMVKT